MSKVFQFGEQMPEYAVAVLNEREARAGAGILFLVAMTAFMQAWHLGNFAPIKLVVVGTKGRPRVDIDGFVVVK